MGNFPQRSRIRGGAFTAPDCRALTTLLPAFRFRQLIGCGRMSAVYRAEQVSLGRDVAIKVLPPELSGFESFSTGFKAEARAMAKLSHPNLIGIYDFGEVGDMLYLVMEFIDGNALHQSIAGGTVEPIQALQIIEGVAQGLGEAHHNHLLHRDIKPASIMITHELKPVLGDFGLTLGTSDTDAGGNPVSSGYLAPETLEDGTASSPASDVYSLGIIMHELVTGIKPQPGAAADLDRVPNFKGLRELVEKVVHRDPSQRPRDGGDFAIILERWLKSASQTRPPLLTGAGPPTRPAAIQRNSNSIRSRSSGRFPATFVILCLMTLGIIALLSFLGRNNESTAPARGTHEDRPSVVTPTTETLSPSGNLIRRQTFRLENHRSEMRNLLIGAANELVVARQRNVVAFQREIVGREKKWAPYLSMIDQGRGLLPRYLAPDRKFTITPDMTDLASRYAFDHQGQLEYRHQGIIRDIYRKSMQTLQREKVAGIDALSDGELEWVEWIGADTFKILARPPDGEWVLRFGPPDSGTVHLIFMKANRVRILDGNQRSEGQFSTTRDGELHVIRQGDAGSWTLRWREPWLDGRDHKGQKVRFRRRAFAFESISADKAEEREPQREDASTPSTPALKDSELGRFQRQFRDTLQRRLSPWFLSYQRKIDQLLEKDTGSGSHLKKEKQRVTSLDWQSGRLAPRSIISHTFIPPELRGARHRLQTEGLKILIDLQDTYRTLLLGLCQKRGSSGAQTEELDAELRPFLAMREVDLGSFYNADPDAGTWLDSRSAATRILPAFKGCRSHRVSSYQISGILQLNSGTYPESISRLAGKDINDYYGKNWPLVIEEIPVYQKAGYVYLVGGLIWSYESAEAEVARVTLNYLDGSHSLAFSLRNQHHIADWYSSRSISAADRIWRGKRRESGRQCAVYEVEIPNPRTGLPIRSITLESAARAAAPFFLGISLGETSTREQNASVTPAPPVESPMERADRKLRERLARETADRERKRKEEEQRRRKSLERSR